MTIVDRHFANLAIAAAIAYTVHPKPLISTAGIFIAVALLIGIYIARFAIETYFPTESNESILSEWVHDVESPAYQSAQAGWVEPFNPLEEFGEEIERYKQRFLAARQTEASEAIKPLISFLFIALAIVIYVVASRGWASLFLIVCSLLAGAIIHATLSNLGAKTTVIILMFASFSAGCYLVAYRQHRSLDLQLLNYRSIPFSIWLLSLGVVAPLIYIAILLVAVLVGGHFESERRLHESNFGRAFAVKELIEAIYNITWDMTCPSWVFRSRVAEHLRKAAHFVRYGLTGLDSDWSADLEQDRRRIYQGASCLLRNWADEAQLPENKTYPRLRKLVRDFLRILMTERDADLPHVEDKGDPPMAKPRNLHLRVLRQVNIIFIAIIPGACLATAKFARLPLPDELGGAATIFSVAWASATLLMQFDTSFEKRLAATKAILAIVRDKRGYQEKGHD